MPERQRRAGDVLPASGNVRAGSLALLRRSLGIASVALSELWRWWRGHAPAGQCVYSAALRLGPACIKLAQVASTRPDVVPPEICARLRDLQERVPPFSFEEARAIVESELGMPLERAYARFERKPVAGASLSQVHLAELSGGEKVAVKVQRPGIRPLVELDAAILRVLARLAELLSPTARRLRLARVVGEFGAWTLRELDFEREAEASETFRANFRGWDDVVFPQVYRSHSTARVLTLERVEGLRVSEVERSLGRAAARALARRLAAVEMKMFVTDAFFHADLHPGNVFFGRDGRIFILDLGMAGRLGESQRDRFLAYWIAVTRRRRQRAFHHLLQLAEVTDGADLAGYRRTYDACLDRFYDRTLEQQSLARTFLEIIVAGARYGVAFPSALVLQAKAVVTAEALDLVLAPDFRFTDEVRPIVARELARRASPRRLLDRLWDAGAEWILFGEVTPSNEDAAPAHADEKDFRRLARHALAAEWSDAADRRLRRWQTRARRYTSAPYWKERPERAALLRNGAAVLHALADGLRRVDDEAALGNSRQPTAEPDNAFSTRWRAFRAAVRPSVDCPSSVGAGLTSAAHRVTNDLGRLHDARFWTERPESAAGLVSLVTLVRVFVAQASRAMRRAPRSPRVSSS